MSAAPPTCKTCRYWSDLVAKKAPGAMHLEALCLSGESDKRGDYTAEGFTCPFWAINSMGAVDEPGRDPMRYRRASKEDDTGG